MWAQRADCGCADSQLEGLLKGFQKLQANCGNPADTAACWTACAMARNNETRQFYGQFFMDKHLVQIVGDLVVLYVLFFILKIGQRSTVVPNAINWLVVLALFFFIASNPHLWLFVVLKLC